VFWVIDMHLGGVSMGYGHYYGIGSISSGDMVWRNLGVDGWQRNPNKCICGWFEYHVWRIRPNAGKRLHGPLAYLMVLMEQR
jgi:hypothetical protein